MLELPKGEVRFEKGTWWPVTTGRNARSDGARSALVTCPLCGQPSSLDGHQIGVDGAVSPSLVCPREGCTWHVWVRLEGWRP